MGEGSPDFFLFFFRFFIFFFSKLRLFTVVFEERTLKRTSKLLFLIVFIQNYGKRSFFVQKKKKHRGSYPERTGITPGFFVFLFNSKELKEGEGLQSSSGIPESEYVTGFPGKNLQELKTLILKDVFFIRPFRQQPERPVRYSGPDRAGELGAPTPLF